MMNEISWEKFAIPGAAAVMPGVNGLAKVVLTHRSGAGAEVYLHGAHVTSWTNSRGEELFFLSRESNFAPDKPIRGGIPVIFPQFGADGPLPMHGFARISAWELAHTEARANGVVAATLTLADSPHTREIWPFAFALELGVLLDAGALTVSLRVRNTGKAAFEYAAALHTYFRVADIRRTAVYGLEGVTSIDDMRGGAREVETRAAIRFAEETDRVYLAAPDALRLEDEGNERAIAIAKRGMSDAVVWNPWIARARRMPDFGDDEYQQMVCVETGNMGCQLELAPRAEWYGETTFRCITK